MPPRAVPFNLANLAGVSASAKMRMMDPEVRHLIEAWHWMYFETDLLFEGLGESNLHRRPGPGLLSVSEHVAHVVRSEASIVNRYLIGEAEAAWADCLMREKPFGWPPTLLESPVHPGLAELTVEQVKDEYIRNHERCYELAKALSLDADFTFDDDWDRVRTVRDRLRIAAYHVGYHCGQIYSARHWLGEETPEN